MYSTTNLQYRCHWQDGNACLEAKNNSNHNTNDSIFFAAAYVSTMSLIDKITQLISFLMYVASKT